MSETTDFEDFEVYSVEASASGDNAYYLDQCGVVGNRPAYAACLKRVTNRKGGRLDVVWAECSAAIGKKECPAMKMREKELKEGKALFFINRVKLRAFSQYREEMSAQRMVSSMGKPSARQAKRTELESPKQQQTKKVAPPVESTHFLDAQTGDYAAAINRAIEEESKKPAVSVERPIQQPQAQPAMKAGLSLIEMARLAMAGKAA